MAILGLLILAAATALGIETALSLRGSTVGFDVFNVGVTLTTPALFLVGALLMAFAILGAFMVTGSMQRRRRLRTVARHRVAEAEGRVSDIDRTNAELVEENDRLRAELAALRRAEATMGGVAVPPGAGNVPYGDQVGDAVRSDTVAQTGRYEPYPVDRARDVDLTESEEKASVLGRFRKE